MRSAFRSTVQKAAIRREDSLSAGLVSFMVGGKDIMGGQLDISAAHAGNGGRLAITDHPWALPRAGFQNPDASNYGSGLLLPRASHGNMTGVVGVLTAATMLVGVMLTGLTGGSNGAIAGVGNSTTSFPVYQNTGNRIWEWRVDSSGNVYLDEGYYTGSAWDGPDTRTVANGALIDSQWHIMGVLQTNTKVRFYLDGARVGSEQSQTGSWGGPQGAWLSGGSANNPLSLLNRSPTGSQGRASYGSVAFFAMWLRALSNEEIARFCADPSRLLSTGPRQQANLFVKPVNNWSIAADVTATGAVVLSQPKNSKHIAKDVTATSTTAAMPVRIVGLTAGVSSSVEVVASTLIEPPRVVTVDAAGSSTAGVAASVSVRRRATATGSATGNVIAVSLGKQTRTSISVGALGSQMISVGVNRKLSTAAVTATSTWVVNLDSSGGLLASQSAEVSIGLSGVRSVRKLLAGVSASATITLIPEGADILEPIVGNVRKVYLVSYVKKRNRMDRLELSSITAEYIDVIFVSKNNVDAFPVSMALSAIGEEPTEWTDAEWVDDENYHRGTKWFNTARCLAGGAGLDITETGDYQLWIRVTGLSDAPVKKAGTVAVS